MKQFAIWALLSGFVLCALAADSDVKRVTANGVEMHYIERGSGDAVILLHGGMGDYRSWAPQTDAFSKQYRVISYSRRYHYPNRNAIDGTNHSAYVEASDLAGLIEALRLGRCHLVGTSYGAFTALALALERPEVVRSIVLAEPPIHSWLKGTSEGGKLYDDFMSEIHKPIGNKFALNDDEGAMRAFVDGMTARGHFDQVSGERKRAIMQNATFFRALTSSGDPYPNLSKEAVKNLKTPALVITGADTIPIHRAVNAELARLLPNRKVVEIARAGHASPRENPEAFNRVVLDFLNTAK